MTLTLKPLDEQVIVITGASSGIGLVTARRAAQRGACVVLAARNEKDLHGATDTIRRAGGRAVYAVADVADAAQVEAIADTAIREFGRFDTWVNNAVRWTSTTGVRCTGPGPPCSICGGPEVP
jgi:NAD(P)-dependent dehydrogenase (short-subunit alcohol dehydrogenase family)